MKKEVLVIFKTHLDIGYTDYSEKVIYNYLHHFLPNAIKVGNQLKGTETPFVWTVGSWLIWEALKRDQDGTVEQATKDGIITWHALPFTSHTELMSAKLFDYGMSLSRKLDERFGRKTTAAKMTDVPGHTIGMVPIMNKNGVDFLHIGVNPGTPNPRVPSLFRWKCGDSHVTVMYEDSYGKEDDFGDFVVYFGHTNDNMGPQSPDEIIALYEKLEKKYPGYEIKAATLEDVAERIRRMDHIPVIEQEIGDTWIHGAGTDPKKLGMYRELLRNIEDRDLNDIDLVDNLLLIPEHTWGMCIQKYFDNSIDWLYEDFKQTKDTDKMVRVEKSWIEQRDYVAKAEEVLGVQVDYKLQEPCLEGYEQVTVKEPDLELSWQLFNYQDFARYTQKYCTLTEENSGWVMWDFTKLGLPAYKRQILTAQVSAVYQKGSKFLYKLEFDREEAKKQGLPYFWVSEEAGEIEVNWFGKEANRLPQAFWLKFKGHKEDWKISKMEQWIKPEEVIGSPLIIGTDKGVCNGEVMIEPLDACLVAPFGRRLLDYPTAEEVIGTQDLYFNLYNNIWNTNFPMWYSDDTRFRFRIKRR